MEKEQIILDILNELVEASNYETLKSALFKIAEENPNLAEFIKLLCETAERYKKTQTAAVNDLS